MADGNVSIATLGIKVDATQPEQAAGSLDKLTAAGARAEESAKKVSSSNAQLADSARKASTDISGMLGAINGSVTQLVGLAKAQTDAATSGAQAAQAMANQQAQVLASIEATIHGVKEFTAGLIEGAMAELKAAEAAGQLATQTRAAGAAADDMAQRVAKLRQAYDPLGVKLAEISAQMKEADNLRRAGAIGAEEHANAISALATQYRTLSTRQTEAGKSFGVLRFAMLDLSRQFSDVGVSAAMGMNPLMILIQQGPQIADAFQMAKMSGVGFTEVLKGMATGAANLLSKIPPIAVGFGGLAVATAAIAISAIKAAQELQELGKIAQGVGATAGLSAESLKRAYEDGAAAAHESTKAAKEQALAFAETGKIGAAAIGKLIPLAKDYAELTGGDAKKATDLLGQAMSGNAKAIVEINDKLHLWNQTQQDHLVTLARENDLTQLQAELLAQLPGQLDAAKPKLDAWTQLVERLADGWHAVAQGMREANQINARGLNYGLNYTDAGPSPAEIAAAGRRMAAAAANDRSTQAGQFRIDAGGQGPGVDAARQQAQAAINAVNARLADVGGANAPSAAEQASLTQSLEAYTHARDTATTADAKAHAVALAQDQSARARTASQKAAAAQALVEAQALGEVVTKGTLAQRAADQARIAGSRAANLGNQSSAAVDAALRDYQSAQLALTKDVAEQARIKHDQVASELKARGDMLARQVSEGSISASAKTIAEGYYKQAADLKNRAIDIEKDHALAQQQLQQRQELAGYLDRQAAANATMATSADAASKLESDTLERRQKLEADILDERLSYLVKLQQITQAAADEERAALAAAQAAEKAAVAEQQRARKIQEQASLAAAPYEADAQILRARQSLARSSYAQAVLNEQIVRDEQKIALIEAQAAVDAAKPNSVEQQVAQMRLDAAQKTADAAEELAHREADLGYGLEEATSSLSSFNDAIKRHDWFGAFNSLMQTLDTVEAMMNRAGTGVGGGGSGIGGLFSRIFGLGGGSGASVFQQQPIIRGFEFLGGSGSDSFSGSLEGLSYSMDSLSAGLAKATNGAGASGSFLSSGGFLSGMSGLAPLAAIAASLLGGKTGNAIGTGLMTGLGASALGGGLSSIGGLLSWGASGIGGLGGAVGGALGSLGGFLSAFAGPIGLIAGIASMFIGGKPSNFTAWANLDANGGLKSLGGDKPNENTTSAAQALGSTIGQGEQLLLSLGIKLGATVTQAAIGQRDASQIHLSDGRVLTAAAGDPAAAADVALKAVLKSATYVSDAEKQLVDSMIAAGEGFDAIATKLQAYAKAQQAVTDVANALLQEVNPQAYDIQQLRASIAAQRQAAEDAYSAGYITADQLTTVNDQLNQLANLKLQDIFKQYANDTSNASSALKKFRDSLDTGANALLSPEAAYLAAKQAFSDTSSKALGGDAQAQAKLQDVSQALLDASKTYFASSGGYFSDLNAVKSAVDQVLAMPGAATADPSLEVQKQQAGLLGDIDKSLVDIKALLAGGPTATAAANDNAATASGAYSYTDPTTGQSYDLSQYLSQLNIPGFATGGSFTVGGSGSGDTQNFGPINLSPGEVGNITRADTMAALLTEIKGLRADNAALRGEVQGLKQTLAKHGEATVGATRQSTGAIVSALDSGKTQRLAAGGSIG